MKNVVLIFLLMLSSAGYVHGYAKADDLSNHPGEDIGIESETLKNDYAKKMVRVYFSGPSGSYHWNREDEANEANWIWGLGVPFRDPGVFWNKEIETFVLRFTNSDGDPSNALGVNLTLGCKGKNIKTCWGFGFAGVDGYERNDRQFVLIKYPIPHLSINYKKFRFSLYVNHITAMYSPGWEFESSQ